MKIKRFVAENMRQALKRVREEQGPDAVILSNQRVNGGIEIVAAVDYDESLIHQALNQVRRSDTVAEDTVDNSAHDDASADLEEQQAPADEVVQQSSSGSSVSGPATITLPDVVWSQEPTLVAMHRDMQNMRGLLEQQLSSLAWNDRTRRDPVFARVLRLLSNMGMEPSVAPKMARSVVDASQPDRPFASLLPVLSEAIPVTGDSALDRGGIIALVGPTGVGKTTTVAKLAARFVLRHGRDDIALISTDTFRIGAQEQLMTFGQILGVPVNLVNDDHELPQVLDSLRDKRLVLIDTAGLSQRDERLSEQLDVLTRKGHNIKLYLTLAANCQFEALDETICRYDVRRLDGCVLTKVDEAGRLGGALSALMRHPLPLAYITDGQRVPEDLYAAAGKLEWLVQSAVRLIRRCGGTVDEEYMARNFGEIEEHAYA